MSSQKSPYLSTDCLMHDGGANLILVSMCFLSFFCPIWRNLYIWWKLNTPLKYFQGVLAGQGVTNSHFALPGFFFKVRRVYFSIKDRPMCPKRITFGHINIKIVSFVFLLQVMFFVIFYRVFPFLSFLVFANCISFMCLMIFYQNDWKIIDPL